MKKEGSESQWTRNVLLAAGIVMALLAVILWFSPVLQSRGTPNCKGNLKMMGVCIQSYYADDKGGGFPILHGNRVDIGNPQEFGFDPSIINCRASRVSGDHHYVWNPKVSGGQWSLWNNANSPLIWDASPHLYHHSTHALFGDGHVEEITPERLKELTR
jgi:prepilin-type processing-associated H-X9-DG protein